jgi:ketosteroid isomerase-like protein
VSTGNVELAGEAIRAMNRRDVEWLSAHCDPGIEMHMTGVVGEPVRYVGATGIRDYFRDMAELWESIEFSSEDIRDLGDRILVVLRHRLRGRASGADVEGTAACVFRLRDGVVTELRSYPDVADALADSPPDS